MIKLMVMDVDGTMTDGSIYYSESGEEIKRFNVKDGLGIKRLAENGIQTMILTGRKSTCVSRRGEELSITYIIQGISNKKSYLSNFLEKNKLDFAEVAYIGDDINDLECIKAVGFSACPNDAVIEIKEQVNQICVSMGGYGAVREFADIIIKNISQEVAYDKGKCDNSSV